MLYAVDAPLSSGEPSAVESAVQSTQEMGMLRLLIESLTPLISITVPPVEAEAMYDPRIWARQAGREVYVSRTTYYRK